MAVPTQIKSLRKRRSVVVVFSMFIALFFQTLISTPPQVPIENEIQQLPQEVLADSQDNALAKDLLESLAVKGRASKTGYKRAEFGNGWAQIGGCDMRNIILQRSISDVVMGADGCIVLNGTLIDPYTSKTIQFERGQSTSDAVQIDHVVALSDAWQKGAQLLESIQRQTLANDPLNLLAVDGSANQQKGDGDAATWLPSNKFFRCRYVARQIAVKAKYGLWVTQAEKAAMIRILNGCGDQRVPVETP